MHFIPKVAGALVLALAAPLSRAQAINIHDAKNPTAAAPLVVRGTLPQPTLTRLAPGEVTLSPGLFRDRRELTKAYLLRLRNENLLQDYYLEAGERVDRPIEDMHQGWEAPWGQLRGHFLGHWMSAMANFAAHDHDLEAAARVTTVVSELARCQQLNGGEWVGSIPEKYFDILAAGKHWVWSPQYTLHKTMMGLSDAYTVDHDARALTVLEHSADWFTRWTGRQLAPGGRPAAVYDGEAPGMLELWANLYGVTHEPRFLELASRYAHPDLFGPLLAGQDPLTDIHTNASVPWIQGAARVYEVTGDPAYRRIVENFWRVAVEQRGMFATTGTNAGEFWIPPHQFNRFLGSRTQEHCTVYNMLRVAEYLYRWTGDTKYADYIERALYNGILAQQNPETGMVTYFLPMEPGGHKVWGSDTKDFWCCHGTMVQAQSMYEDLIYYAAKDGIDVSQYVPSTATLTAGGAPATITQSFDNAAMSRDFTASQPVTHWIVAFTVHADQPHEWTLRLRRPEWVDGEAQLLVNGQPVTASAQDGYYTIRRTWQDDRVTLSLPKRLRAEPLPGDATRFALLDGPVVLAGLSDRERSLDAGNDGAPVKATPVYEHMYLSGRDWQWGHYLVQSGTDSLTFEPLYEVKDERYTVYFRH